jgi:hypothetical protein
VIRSVEQGDDMPRQLLWGIAGVAAAATVSLVVVLWRRRKDEHGKLTTGDYLVALGIVLALFGTALSLLAAQTADESEPEEVARFRNDAKSTCTALAANNQVSLDVLVDTNGNIDRGRLVDTFDTQLDAAAAILTALWEPPLPAQLVTDVEVARQAGDVLLDSERAAVGAMATELPQTVPFQQAVLYLQQMSAEQLPNATAFQGAMSGLAGQECRPV